ncbi:hypothetical protein [Bradyrhizobium sp. 169]|uniref:hypothetical protein n=1 Tax=Bradyrhizobium sp. 169 TaxID=2782640 RepID=UPI001FFC0E5A|nr:hypothetical protein [Bradyrhizobium sp. 169]MCK1586930.1 hypothetical protein [Bradyrhizobium sp. 169]
MELNLPALTNRLGAELIEQTSSSSERVAGYATRICQNWRKTVEGILDVGKDCAAAKDELTESEKRELYANLPFGESMLSKLATIGEDSTRLFAHREFLPSSISTLYLLCRLPNDRFELAFAEGLVRPDVTRDDVEKWTSESNSEDEPEAVSIADDEPKAISQEKRPVPARLYCLIADEMPTDEQHSHYETELLRCAEELDLKFQTFPGENWASEFQEYLAREVQPA